MPANENHTQPSSHPDKAFWVTFGAGHGPEIPYKDTAAHSQFGISIYTEAQVANCFSGFRVLILRSQDASRSLALNECEGFDLHERGFDKPPIVRKELVPATRTGYRETLQKKPRKLKNNHGLLNQGPALPIWTIALELVEIMDDSLVNHTLIPMTGRSQGVLPQGHILFDRTWVRSDGDLSTIIWFDMDAGDFTRFLLHPKSHYSGREVPIFLVRLLPVGISQAPIKDLPSRVIKLIVRHALDPSWEDDWTNRVLDLSLLRKSWLPALDIFWEVFGDVQTTRRANPILIARSLQKQPNRAHLISSFCDNSYNTWRSDTSVDPTMFRDACQTIISSARHSLTHLDIEGGNLPAITSILSDMKNLRRFTVSSHPPGIFDIGNTKTWSQIITSQQPSPSRVVTIKQIGEAFNHWQSIQGVNIGGLLFDDTKEVPMYDGRNQGEVASSIRRPLNSTLKSLTIEHSHLDGHSLRRFSSTTLTLLHLYDITKIQNADLVELLTSARMSLEEIHMYDCETVIEEGQLHAIEQILPRMTRINWIQLVGEQGLSSKIISAKQQSNQDSSKKNRDELDITVGRLGQSCTFEALAKAIEVTGWGSIRLQRSYSPDDPLWKEAKSVADRRGVNLTLEYFY